ncbi:hypothetical protein CDL15_Pgr017999 [Punica granatum]|uniref:Uncharacterized protein n=1 Tax=Punica granatum TaxID=22663 RepID=A0A218WHF2_PUNGR|nr:hypothetical protein CDL15_Pgr017999 [Punica granatum]
MNSFIHRYGLQRPFPCNSCSFSVKEYLQKKKKAQAKSDKSSPETLVRTYLRLEDELRRGRKENGRRRGSREEASVHNFTWRLRYGDFEMLQPLALCNCNREEEENEDY